MKDICHLEKTKGWHELNEPMILPSSAEESRLKLDYFHGAHSSGGMRVRDVEKGENLQ